MTVRRSQRKSSKTSQYDRTNSTQDLNSFMMHKNTKDRLTIMNSDDAIVVDMDGNNELNVARIRTQYEALLPKYGTLWRKMVSSSRPTPKRQPLSLLPAIENQKAISLRVPTKQCQCPWDESCQGCAEPIVEIINDESSNDDDDDEEEALSSSSSSSQSFSSKDSEDTAPVCFDLSNLRLDDDEEESKDNAVESQETEFPVTLEPEPFRSGNNDSFAESSEASTRKSSVHNDDASDEEDEDSPSSCSSNGSTVQVGWDLSFLRLNDNEQESKKGVATNDDKSQENDNNGFTSITSEAADSFEQEQKWLKNRQKEKEAMSQAISLLDDSDSDASIHVQKPVNNNNNKTRSNMQERRRVVFASDSSSSSSSEEEWNESKQSTKKEEGVKCMSPTVIVLSDSEEEDGNDEWHDANDGRDDEKDSLDDSEESFGEPSTFAREKKHVKTAASIVSSTAPRKKEGQSKAAFQKNRQEIADLAFAEFDRVAFDGALRDVDLVWSKKLRTTAGLTRLKQISGGGDPTKRTATIELSTKIIDEEHRLRATLLHEMCHAAAWLVDGVSKPPHGACFRKWAIISMQKVRKSAKPEWIRCCFLCLCKMGFSNSLHHFITGTRCACDNDS